MYPITDYSCSNENYVSTVLDTFCISKSEALPIQNTRSDVFGITFYKNTRNVILILLSYN